MLDIIQVRVHLIIQCLLSLSWRFWHDKLVWEILSFTEWTFSDFDWICLDIFPSYMLHIRQDTPTLPLELAFFGAAPLPQCTYVVIQPPSSSNLHPACIQPHHCSSETFFALSHSWKDKQSGASRWWGKVFSLLEQGFQDVFISNWRQQML